MKLKTLNRSPCSLFPRPYTLTSGYVALISVLVIAAVVLTIGIVASLLSINEIQNSLASKKNEESVDMVEGCVEDGLLRLNETNAIPAQIPLPEGTCDVTIDAQTGSLWTFTVSGTVDTYTKKVQVSADRGSVVSVTSWKEVN